MRRNYAIINIGTLKTKCLVAQLDESDRIVPLYTSNNLTCFGCAMFENKNNILKKNLEATIKEILRLKEVIKRYRCGEVNNVSSGGAFESQPSDDQRIKLFATHALRDASNREEVISEIKEKTGFDVEVISPQEEGNFYFQAVMNDFDPVKNYAVCDMGGGSIQILLGNKEKLLKGYSFKTGAQFLHEKFTEDPHNPESFTAREHLMRMKDYLEEQYSVIGNNLTIPLVYGSSNIVDLCKVLEIPLESCQDSLNHPYKTYPQYFSDFIDYIITFPYKIRESMYRFQKGYMWGVDKAFLNIITLAKKFNSPYIIPSNTSIMEGFLYSLRDRNSA